MLVVRMLLTSDVCSFQRSSGSPDRDRNKYEHSRSRSPPEVNNDASKKRRTDDKVGSPVTSSTHSQVCPLNTCKYLHLPSGT